MIHMLSIWGCVMSYEFELPWPPSINGYWRAFNNRQIISKRGREYREDCIAAMGGFGLYNEGLHQRLSVSLTLNPKTLRSYDVDNFTKAVFDSLTHARFWGDDSQVDILTVKKGVKTPGGNVIVKVEIIGEDQE